MERAKKSYYVHCFVPNCRSSQKTTPEKIFFDVPRKANERRQWCEAVNILTVPPASTPMFCCENHFILDKDVENWIKYKILKLSDVKQTVRLKLKEGVLPSRVTDTDEALAAGSNALVESGEEDPLRRSRLDLLKESEEAGSFIEVKHNAEIEADEQQSSEDTFNYLFESRMSVDVACQTINVSPRKKTFGCQVKIRHKYRSVGVQTEPMKKFTPKPEGSRASKKSCFSSSVAILDST